MKSPGIFFLVCLFAFDVFALVDMKSASYTNTWTDLQAPGAGYELRVVRAYRSRTLYSGMFGFGWCSEFETKLTVNSTGGVRINECGDGQETVYHGKRPDAAEIADVVNAIVEKLKIRTPTVSRNYLADLAKRMKADASLRERYAAENGVLKMPAQEEKLYAAGNGAEYVVLEKNFFTRRFLDGSSQRFDLGGRLTHVYNKFGQFLKLEYKQDLLSEITDDSGRKLTFKFYPHNRVQKITGPNSTSAEYFYKDDTLVKVTVINSREQSTEFAYEYNEFKNLIKAVWPDKSAVFIKYDNKKDWVVSFTDRDSCIEVYKYENSKDQPKLHYWATATKSCNNEVVTKNRYEFWNKLRADGEIVPIRILTKIKNDAKDTFFDENLQKPLKIVFNGQETTYTYFEDGLLKSKKTADRMQEFSYDESTRKISKISEGKEISKFKYDKKGNLVFVENSAGKKIDITYDLSGRIKTLIDNNKTKITLDYEDKFGKPSVITKAGEGSVNIIYTGEGEIQKVDSKGGPQLAGQIASTFNTFLEIIAPANQLIY